MDVKLISSRYRGDGKATEVLNDVSRKAKIEVSQTVETLPADREEFSYIFHLRSTSVPFLGKVAV